jgi:predicted NUDIX family NTP pyrophosphohydrolase
MAKQSAGILLFRRRSDVLEVFLVHPGGPFWAKKDDGAWSIPKGEFMADEEPLDAARREFTEETGLTLDGPFTELGEVKQSGGKRVLAWATEGDCDPAAIACNTCRVEWPPRSGRTIEFPEVDRAAWFESSIAAGKLNPAQSVLIQRLKTLLENHS